MKNLIYLPFLLGMVACSDEGMEVPQYAKPKGAVKVEKFFNSLEAENPVRFNEYKYDAKGNPVRIDYFEYPDFMYSYVQKEYDLQNRVREEAIYVWQIDKMAKGTTSMYEYENDKLVKTSFYNHNETFSGEHTFEYDEQGNQIKISVYQLIGGLIAYYNFEYKDNHLFRELHYEGGDLIRAYEYQYDKSGRLVKRFFLADVADTQDWVQSGVDQEYFYDEQGKLIKMIQYDPWWGYGILEVIAYEYY